MRPDEKFSWDSPESRAYLRALMHEQETLFASIDHANTRFPETLDPRCTVAKLNRIKAEGEAIEKAYEEARAATQAAAEALASEMQQWLSDSSFDLDRWMAENINRGENG